MRWYQMLGLLAVVLGVAVIGWLTTARGAPGTAPARAAAGPAVACEDCKLPARPAGEGTTKPPAIPTGSGLPCLVEFGTGTCAECRQMAQVLGELAPLVKGKVDIIHVDAEVHLGEVQRWRVRIVPTQILVDAHGEELWRHEGVIAAAELRKRIEASGAVAP